MIQHELIKTWAHDELAGDLARHLSNEGRMVWTDMQLGPQGSPRPDVYRIDKSFVKPCPMAYECKISRSDFLADVTVGKWRSYLSYAYAVVFAVPDGLVKSSEVPDMCGLIVRKENAWRLAKRPTMNPHPIAEHALLKLLIDGVAREGPIQRKKTWNDFGSAFSKKFGSEAARYVCDAATIHARLEQADLQANAIREKARKDAEAIRARQESQGPKFWQQLVNILGLSIDANEYNVRDAISELQRRTEGGAYKAELMRVLSVEFQVQELITM